MMPFLLQTFVTPIADHEAGSAVVKNALGLLINRAVEEMMQAGYSREDALGVVREAMQGDGGSAT